MSADSNAPAPPESALQAFVMRMEEIWASNKHVGESDVETARLRYAFSCLEIAQLLQSCDDPHKISVQFIRAFDALRDLGKGVTHPVFVKRRRAGRPPDRSDVWEVRTFAVFALDLMTVAHSGNATTALAELVKAPQTKTIEQTMLIERGASLKTSILSWQTALEEKREVGMAAQTIHELNRKQLAAWRLTNASPALKEKARSAYAEAASRAAALISE